MHVQVIILPLVAAQAQFVTDSVASVLERVYEMPVPEQRQRAEYPGLVYAVDAGFEFGQGYGPFLSGQSPEYKQPVGGFPNAVTLQQLYEIFPSDMPVQ